jgi:hypothetical protein
VYSELLCPVLSSRTWCAMWTVLDSISAVVALVLLRELRVRLQMQMRAGSVGGSSYPRYEVSSGLRRGDGERDGGERMKVYMRCAV